MACRRPHESNYFMMIVGLYASWESSYLECGASPEANLTLIWFTVCSSIVHAAIMAAQSLGGGHHMGHLWGDVPAPVFS